MDDGLEADGKIYRQGYLQKKKSVTKSVKKRWHCLNSDAFVTFRSEECAGNNDECQGVLPLIEIQTVKKQHTASARYPFEIITRHKTHVFLTDSAFEQDQWVKAFHSAMKLRCFHTQKNEVMSKYTSNGRDRRSSAGAKKLSHFKHYVQDGLKPMQHRKSSSVDCDPNETEYQGIPIGTTIPESESDDVFEATEASLVAGCQQIVNNEAQREDDNDDDDDDDDIDKGGCAEQNLGSVDSDQSLPSPQGFETSSECSKTDTVDTSIQLKNGDGCHSDNSEENVTSLPSPVPASTGLSRSPKKVFTNEQIYDVPPRDEEGIYDIPAREDDALPESTAMNDLKNMLDCDIYDTVDSNNPDKFSDVRVEKQSDNFETTLTGRDIEKSAVDELRNLLDSLDEL